MGAVAEDRYYCPFCDYWCLGFASLIVEHIHEKHNVDGRSYNELYDVYLKQLDRGRIGGHTTMKEETRKLLESLWTPREEMEKQTRLLEQILEALKKLDNPPQLRRF
jgi:hypothetical protein